MLAEGASAVVVPVSSGLCTSGCATPCCAVRGHLLWKGDVASYIYITFYIYVFSRRFYPKRLTVHSGIFFLSVCVFPGN